MAADRSPMFKFNKNKQILYLEIHNIADGQKTFKCATRYDFYVLQNKDYYINTIIKDEECKINSINLKEWKFIPNMMFNEIKKLIDNKDKLTLIHSESNYEVRRKWMSHTKTETHIYSCVYSINKENEFSFK